MIGALLGLLLAPGPASSVDRWSRYVSEASLRFGVPEAWIRSVMRAESGGRTLLDGRPIESPKGALGLMQVMPRTWRQLSARYGLGEDPQDPRANILAGTAYLREMHDRFGYPGLFGAYNAGPGRYAEHLAGRPLPLETIAYMRAVAGTAPPARAARAQEPPTIFVALSPAQPAPGSGGERRGLTAGSVLLARLSAADGGEGPAGPEPEEEN